MYICSPTVGFIRSACLEITFVLEIFEGRIMYVTIWYAFI